MYDLERIKLELDSLPQYERQIYLQGNSKDMDPLWPTIGDNYLWVDDNEEQFDIPLFNIPYINSIIQEHDLIRTRVMLMPRKTCYYWHKDDTKRLHIPIQTHEHCFLVFDDGPIHMPADGNYYWMDTTRYHTAMNCSKIDRIHIVGAERP